MPLGDIIFSATNLKSGADADKPSSPKVGDLYVATDTKIVYACYVNGSWERQPMLRAGTSADILTMPRVQGDMFFATDQNCMYRAHTSKSLGRLDNYSGGPTAGKPANPLPGDAYLDTDTGTFYICLTSGNWVDITEKLTYSQVLNLLKTVNGMVYNDGTNVYARIGGTNINIESFVRNVHPGFLIRKQDSNIEGGEFVLEGPNATYPNVTIDHYKGMVRMWQPGTVSGLRIFSVPTLGANAFDGYLCPVLPDNVAPSIISQQYWSDTTPGSYNTPAITGPAYILGGIATKQTHPSYNYSFCSRVINGVAEELTFVKGAAGQDIGRDGKIGFAFISPFYLRPGEVTYWHVESTYSGSSTVEHGASVQVAYIQL
jgi:hypothetical protein